MSEPEDFTLQVDLGKKPRKQRKPRDPNAPKKERHARDAYPTVVDLAVAIATRVWLIAPSPRAILEPTAGDGPFVTACRSAFGVSARIAAVDINGACNDPCLKAGASIFVQSDILDIPREQIAKFDLIIGNLPFNDAARILAHLSGANPEAVIFNLAPVGFFGRTTEIARKDGSPVTPRNAAFWAAVQLRYFAPIHPRPSFTGDGRTDRMEYGLFGFGANLPNLQIGDPIVWRPE